MSLNALVDILNQECLLRFSPMPAQPLEPAGLHGEAGIHSTSAACFLLAQGKPVLEILAHGVW